MEKRSDILGDIIRVDDANTYIAKIQPDAKKEHIGRFIKISRDDGIIVGVVRNITNSIPEDLIPYIDPEFAPKYAPFNTDFRNSYYVIHALGTIYGRIVKYSVDSPPEVRDKVEILGKDEFRSFHTKDGKPSIAYFHASSEILSQHVLVSMIEQIEAQFPESKAMLNLVRKYIMRDL